MMGFLVELCCGGCGLDLCALRLKDRVQQTSRRSLTTRTRLVQAHIQGKSVCLDPLLQALSSFDTVDELSGEMTMMFRWLDTDDSGELTFLELKEGFERLKVCVAPLFVNPKP